MRLIDTHIDIDAPAHVVWKIMDDLPAYPEWNKIVVSLTGRTTLDKFVTLDFRPEGLIPMPMKSRITRVVPLRELRWQKVVPGIMRAEHIFILKPTGPNTCRFINREYFSGLMAALIWKKLDPSLHKGYNEMNLALKSRAEAHYAAELAGSSQAVTDSEATLSVPNQFSGSEACSVDKLHPSLKQASQTGAEEFGGGTLHCQCKQDKVEVSVTEQCSHNHLCGCSA